MSNSTHYVYVQDPPPPYSEATGNPAVVVTPIPISQNATVITVPPPSRQQQQVLLIGNCPVCRVGVLKSRPTCLGILLCILFFPFVFTGLCFLFLLQEAYCPNCGASS